MAVMSSGALVADLRGGQWVVRDGNGKTIAWTSPAAKLWSASVLDGPGPDGRFGTPRAALDALGRAMTPAGSGG